MITTAEYHRAQVRQSFSFRQATVEDAEGLAEWLLEQALRWIVPFEDRFDDLPRLVGSAPDTDSGRRLLLGRWRLFFGGGEDDARQEF